MGRPWPYCLTWSVLLASTVMLAMRESFAEEREHFGNDVGWITLLSRQFSSKRPRLVKQGCFGRGKRKRRMSAARLDLVYRIEYSQSLGGRVRAWKDSVLGAPVSRAHFHRRAWPLSHSHLREVAWTRANRSASRMGRSAA